MDGRLSPDQNRTLASFFESEDRVTQGLLDRLLCAQGGFAVPQFVVLHLRAFLESPRNVPPTPLVPVHGPFAPDIYNNPEFVAHYTDVRYETRVKDIETILRSCDGRHIIAPGDGAGVAFRAVANLIAQGKKMTIESSDSSQIMCDIAAELGNVVSRKTIDEVVHNLPLGCVVLLSHVTDYMDEYQMQACSSYDTIVYGRASVFAGARHFCPYDKKWGFQLCSTRGFPLSGIMLLTPPKVLDDLDYSVFACLADTDDDRVCIGLENPRYLFAADAMGFSIDPDANLVVTDRPFNYLGRDVAVPYMFRFSQYEGSHLFTLPMLADYGYIMALRQPIFQDPVAVGSKFFCPAPFVRVDSPEGMYVVKPYELQGRRFFRFEKYRRGVVRIECCSCHDRPRHSHVLNIVPNNRVEMVNLIAHIKRKYKSSTITRARLYSEYTSLCGSEEFVLWRFGHMERVLAIEFDELGNLLDKDDRWS
jgi:hypothetical protein